MSFIGFNTVQVQNIFSELNEIIKNITDDNNELIKKLKTDNNFNNYINANDGTININAIKTNQIAEDVLNMFQNIYSTCDQNKIDTKIIENIIPHINQFLQHKNDSVKIRTLIKQLTDNIQKINIDLDGVSKEIEPTALTQVFEEHANVVITIDKIKSSLQQYLNDLTDEQKIVLDNAFNIIENINEQLKDKKNINTISANQFLNICSTLSQNSNSIKDILANTKVASQNFNKLYDKFIKSIDNYQKSINTFIGTDVPEFNYKYPEFNTSTDNIITDIFNSLIISSNNNTFNLSKLEQQSKIESDMSIATQLLNLDFSNNELSTQNNYPSKKQYKFENNEDVIDAKLNLVMQKTSTTIHRDLQNTKNKNNKQFNEQALLELATAFIGKYRFNENDEVIGTASGKYESIKKQNLPSNMTKLVANFVIPRSFKNLMDLKPNTDHRKIVESESKKLKNLLTASDYLNLKDNPTIQHLQTINEYLEVEAEINNDGTDKFNEYKEELFSKFKFLRPLFNIIEESFNLLMKSPLNPKKIWVGMLKQEEDFGKMRYEMALTNSRNNLRTNQNDIDMNLRESVDYAQMSYHQIDKKEWLDMRNQIANIGQRGGRQDGNSEYLADRLFSISTVNNSKDGTLTGINLLQLSEGKSGKETADIIIHIQNVAKKANIPINTYMSSVFNLAGNLRGSISSVDGTIKWMNRLVDKNWRVEDSEEIISKVVEDTLRLVPTLMADSGLLSYLLWAQTKTPGGLSGDWTQDILSTMISHDKNGNAIEGYQSMMSNLLFQGYKLLYEAGGGDYGQGEKGREDIGMSILLQSLVASGYSKQAISKIAHAIKNNDQETIKDIFLNDSPEIKTDNLAESTKTYDEAIKKAAEQLSENTKIKADIVSNYQNAALENKKTMSTIVDKVAGTLTDISTSILNALENLTKLVGDFDWFKLKKRSMSIVGKIGEYIDGAADWLSSLIKYIPGLSLPGIDHLDEMKKAAQEYEEKAEDDDGDGDGFNINTSNENEEFENDDTLSEEEKQLRRNDNNYDKFLENGLLEKEQNKLLGISEDQYNVGNTKSDSVKKSFLKYYEEQINDANNQFPSKAKSILTKAEQEKLKNIDIYNKNVLELCASNTEEGLLARKLLRAQGIEYDALDKAQRSILNELFNILSKLHISLGKAIELATRNNSVQNMQPSSAKKQEIRQKIKSIEVTENEINNKIQELEQNDPDNIAIKQYIDNNSIYTSGAGKEYMENLFDYTQTRWESSDIQQLPDNDPLKQKYRIASTFTQYDKDAQGFEPGQGWTDEQYEQFYDDYNKDIYIDENTNMKDFMPKTFGIAKQSKKSLAKQFAHNYYYGINKDGKFLSKVADPITGEQESNKGFQQIVQERRTELSENNFALAKHDFAKSEIQRNKYEYSIEHSTDVNVDTGNGSSAYDNIPKAEWKDAIDRYAQQYNVNKYFIAAMLQVESGWDPTIVSHAGAIGLAQIMPDTAASLGVNPYDPIQAIEGAAKYTAELRDQMGTDDLRWLAAGYNAGGGAAKGWIQQGVSLEDIPYNETRHHVVKVMNAMKGNEKNNFSSQMFGMQSNIKLPESKYEQERKKFKTTKSTLNYYRQQMKAFTGKENIVYGGLTSHGIDANAAYISSKDYKEMADQKRKKIAKFQQTLKAKETIDSLQITKPSMSERNKNLQVNSERLLAIQKMESYLLTFTQEELDAMDKEIELMQELMDEQDNNKTGNISWDVDDNDTLVQLGERMLNLAKENSKKIKNAKLNIIDGKQVVGG